MADTQLLQLQEEYYTVMKFFIKAVKQQKVTYY